MEFLSQRPMYSTDPSTKGFDLSSGQMWIYPENYPHREYQFEIVKSALYHNTLVCLPTGLGKTFIAAVVMYNFWRWYPLGKIVFLAPTKPLVAQQINACRDIMGIPSSETIELTGATDQKKRQIAWLEHRVIFATPQVFHKDLEKDIVPSDSVKCVVVDEAHKALGKHSYCESIRLLSEQNQYFRVLALSATPGGKLDAVQKVVRNLHITHMELRDDKSPDIIPYINERKLDIVLVGLGAELEGYKDRYITIMDRHVRLLVENNVLRGFAGNISKGRIFHIQKEWQQKPDKGGNHSLIMKTLMILMTMYHAYELMVRHGLRAFYNFYQNHMNKFWLNDEKELLRLLEEINYYLGPFPDVRPLPDGNLPEIPEDTRFGHKKFQKLKELLLRHFESFENKEEETRAIVFVEYRDIVNEVYVLLLQSRPLIRPQKFVGQAGQKQKQQKLALEDFRSNKVNVLISTSVGEEGLDVGEVDLIVCFDISQHSPIRLVQRMGRTGRKRDGHIVVLVTDGKEHQTLKSTMSRRDSLNNKVLQSSGIINALHEESPRMVPAEFDPECQKMVMTVEPKIAPTKGKGKTKDPKKLPKRADAKSKMKNSKLSAPSTSNKPGGSQSSLMRFLKKPTEDPQMEVDDDIVGLTMNEIPSLSVPANRVTQSSEQSLKNNSAIKLSEVKLLSSDNAAVEFLTLCTMKKSENEQTYIDNTRTNPYLPSYHTNTEKNENFFDFKVPDLQILDYLKNLTDYEVHSTENEKDDAVICEPSNRFNGCNDFYAFSRHENLEEDSKFEALLDESTDDSQVTVFQPKEVQNNDFPVNEQVDWAENVDGLGFEDLLDEWSEESKTSAGENEIEDNKANEIPCQPPNDLLDEPGVFEDILDSSTDESETGCSLQNIDAESKTPEKKVTTKNRTETTIDNSSIESKGAFEDILNSSSDESETDCSLQIEPDVPYACKQISPTKSPIQLPIESELRDSLQGPKQIRTPRISVDIEIDESTDLLADYVPKVMSQLSAADNDRRHFKIFSDPPEPSTSGIAKNSTQVSCSQLTLSQTLSEIERIHSTKHEYNKSKVNIANQGETENERSTSPVFPDRPRASWTSRLSGTSAREPPRELILSHSNDPVDETAESEEDIFGIDDFTVDSDFETEINNIEKSVDQNVNTERKKSCEPCAKNTDEDNAETEIVSDKISVNQIFKQLCPPPAEASKPEIKISNYDRSGEVANNLCLPAIESFCPSELNLDDCECDNEEAKNPTPPSAKESVSDTVDLTDCDWSTEEARISISLPAKESLPDTADLDYCDWGSEIIKDTTPPPVKEPSTDVVLDDYDWSSDIETFSTPLKASTSYQKIVEIQDSPKSISNSLTSANKNDIKLSKIVDTSGWISTEKPKLCLSLGKKLTKNIRNSLLTKKICKNPPATTHDSDSENDFTVGRLETTLTKQVESDFFAKPDPVDKVTSPQSLGMSNPRRILRGPLSVRRNDVNKLSIKGLGTFTAPNKYMQQHEARRNVGVGAGRQKSASLDLETRKKKKKHRAERKRVRIRSEFIDDEAEVSTDDNHTSGSSGTDDDLEDFVSYTQYADDSDDMQAHYLQTIRSPRRTGGFHIRKPKSPTADLQIYSQALPDETNAYLHDSFCVAEDDEVFEDSETPDEISLLEEIEMNLKSKKRKRVKSEDTRANQKRRVVVRPTDTSSSEDEFEKLRRQIHDESFVLRNRCD